MFKRVKSISCIKQIFVPLALALSLATIGTAAAEDSIEDRKARFLKMKEARKNGTATDAPATDSGSSSTPESTIPTDTPPATNVALPTAPPALSSAAPPPTATSMPSPASVTPLSTPAPDKPADQATNTPGGSPTPAADTGEPAEDFKLEKVEQVNRDWTEMSSEREKYMTEAANYYTKISDVVTQSEKIAGDKDTAYEKTILDLNKSYNDAYEAMGKFVEIGKQLESYVQQNMAKYTEKK
jgi:hypothetical protein